MVTPPDETTADPYAVIAALRQQLAERSAERDVALAEKAALAEALTTRNSEYGERIEHQSATIDVLKAMSASPGDPQPVFDLITNRVVELCNGMGSWLFEYDGEMVHARSTYGIVHNESATAAHAALFPCVPTRDILACRAILDRQIIHIRDMDAEPDLNPSVRASQKSVLVLPLIRDGTVVGSITLNSRVSGGFSDIQVALLQIFAEQAVIAITSAETYRALRTRTADLQKTLEYQTATSDVLKVISGSSFLLEPVFQTVVETALRLCRADQAVIFRLRDGAFRWAAGMALVPEYERRMRAAAIHPGTDTLIGRVALQGRPVQILDEWTDPLYSPKQVAQVGGVHTSLGVPLLRDGVTIGAIGLGRLRVEPFTEQQIELVSTFADQAVIAIENARLLTEQQEALEQQTATADVLRVINGSPGDLFPVFNAILEWAHRVCDADGGALYTYDGTHVRVMAVHGFPPDHAAEMLARAPFPPPNTVVQQMITTGRFVQVEDAQVARARLGVSYVQDLDVSGMRTAAAIPLLKDGRLMGYITAWRRDVRLFSDKQIALLENFAAQAVIAMENGRLLMEQREALEQQTATAEVLQVINASPGSFAPVFEVVLEKALRLCEATFGLLLTYDGDYHLAAQHGVPTAFLKFWESNAPLDQHGGGAARLLETKRPVQTLDVREGEGYRTGIPISRALVDLAGGRTLLGVPLLKDGAVVGAILIYRREVRAFSDKQIALLENFAAQAVIAMENARLLHELRARTEELAQRQAELRVTFENMGDGVAMFDETQHLIAWNGKFREIFDLPDALLEPHSTYEEYLRFLAARGDFGPGVYTVEQITELVASTGQPYGYERTRPDGRVIETRRNPVPDGGFVLIYSDITERKRSEEEIRAARDAAEAALQELKAAQANLIQAEKMASLGQLTAGIAHEIKNPLNFVNNFASLSIDLLDELKQTATPAFAILDADRRAEIDDLTRTLSGNLEKINEHGNRADAIVRSMLEHSRGSSGEQRAVDLNTLVDEALNLAYHGARARDQNFNITLHRDFDEVIVPITLVPQDITRVLLNLFSNGFYAARQRQSMEAAPGFEPAVSVATRELGDAVQIKVRDNGIGIPEELKDRLFQPFFTTKPTGEGTGLGLSISYDIVTQQHGGSITVDSKVGEYSEFTIRLPRNS